MFLLGFHGELQAGGRNALNMTIIATREFNWATGNEASTTVSTWRHGSLAA
jgi:hypothetical protein